MKHILIYDISVKGHHLEYLHHIYIAAEDVDAEFIFVVPEEYNLLKRNLLWPTRHNVSFDFISNAEVAKIGGGYLKRRWCLANLAAKYIRRHKSDEVFFVDLIVQFPFLPFLIPKRVKVSGIIYRLVPYEWKKLTLFTKIKDVIELFIIGRHPIVKVPMSLNDNSCACYYNKKLGTKKFIFVADPVNSLKYHPKSVRNEIGVDDNDKVLLHFGMMNERKGTLTVLEAICMIDEQQLKNKVFIFAGQVCNDIRYKFDGYISQLSKKVRIVVYDGFCSFELLSDLCFSCNCVIIPYYNTSYSSGVIGYAALFQKTIVGPSGGLLGKLIKRNKLGLVIEKNNASSLAKIINSDHAYKNRPNNYPQRNSMKAFTKTIFNALNIDYKKQIKQRISVIIPLYNQEKYIGKCIRSVLDQSFQDFEIIVVNDGSTDSSMKICRKYAKKDHRISIIEKQNEGLSRARRDGFLKATGDYIFFLDSDDYISRDALIKLITLANKHNLDIVAGNHDRVCDSWGFISHKSIIYERANTLISGDDLFRMWLGSEGDFSKGGILVWGQLIRRTCITEALKNNGDNLFPPGHFFNEDVSFNIAIAPYVKSCWMSNEIIYHYRIGGCTMNFQPSIRKGGFLFDYKYELCLSLNHIDLLPFVLTHYKIQLISDVARQLKIEKVNKEEVCDFINKELKSRKIAIWAQETETDQLKSILNSAIMRNKALKMHFIRMKLARCYQKIVDRVSCIIEMIIY